MLSRKKFPITSFQRIFITGASSGIGAALAEKLGQKGCSLILLGRNQKALENIAFISRAEKSIVADLREQAGREVARMAIR